MRSCGVGRHAVGLRLAPCGNDGRADTGSFKLGRDYGLYGQNAILSDMTLVGAGATVAATQRNRVTLGQKGVSVSDLEPPKRKGLSLSDVPTEAPELPAGLPEVPNPLQ